jgi:tetratricopeptide (TPR) repeat protein
LAYSGQKDYRTKIVNLRLDSDAPKAARQARVLPAGKRRINSQNSYVGGSSQMKKKTVLVSAVILLTVLAILLIVKNLDYLVNKYQWHKADIAAETRHDETLKKFKAGQKLSSTEINQLIAYYSLTSKEDEGINLLQEILRKQDSYMAYFGLSQLYAAKAEMKASPDAHRDFISKSFNYLTEGFGKVPDKALAYYTRGTAYAILGCSEPYMNDLKKALEESKKVKTVMLAEGFYVDQIRFAEVIEKDINRHKDWHGTCLLDEIQHK